ncbi:MAG TPA: histidinol-phosphatase [Phycisphaerae bacterium]|nr:histidinol-phosphatase [Phycisphaerae bacterium]
MNAPDIKPRLELALDAARRAGRLTLKHFNRPGLDIEQKRDGTPVTVADRQAEEFLRKMIVEAFPDDAILGEEMPDRPGSSGFRWIIDPIDGTKSFIHGVPLFGTLVGVEFDKQSVIGVIVLPALDEYVYAAVGQGAWHQRGWSEPRRAKVSEVDRLKDATFCTTSVSEFVIRGRDTVYDELRERCRLARGWGDCYGYVLVATGRAEIMIEPQLSLWDMAALPPILAEAGGYFGDWKGTPTIYAGDSLATNAHLREQVLAITRGK